MPKLRELIVENTQWAHTSAAEILEILYLRKLLLAHPDHEKLFEKLKGSDEDAKLALGQLANVAASNDHQADFDEFRTHHFYGLADWNIQYVHTAHCVELAIDYFRKYGSRDTNHGGRLMIPAIELPIF